MRLVDDADAALTDELLHLIDEEAVCGDHDTGVVENGAELAALFEVERVFAS